MNIIEILKSSGADGWAVTDEIREGWEFYFVRHRLDQNRIRHTQHTKVTVYKKFEDGKFLGSATAEVNPTATEAEAKSLIDSLVQEAQLVRNPYYELNKPTEDRANVLAGEASASEAKGSAADQKASKAEQSVRTIAEDFLRTMQDLEETATEDVNSYEIFTDSVTRHLITSTGIDVTSVFPSSMVEVVVNARNDAHEIELYRMYKSGSCDKAGLKAEIEQTLGYGHDKLKAVKTPALGSCDVVFSTDAAISIYEYFLARMSTGMKYQQISDWEIGKEVVEDAAGDRITAKALRFLENSSDNASCDSEGALRRDMTIIENGVARNYFGSRQFSQYLGIEDSFNPGNYLVEGGKSEAKELRTGRYLEVVEFSDFQVSPMNGDIFGEIRLGYLHEDDKVTIVEGGSVSGTMRDFARHMQLSKELKQYNNICIPAVTRLKDVSITGAV